MKYEFIPVNEPFFNGNEKKYLNECIDSGWVSSSGPFVDKFEKEVAKRANREFATSVSSGTAALDLAVRILDIKEGDEVITSNFSIISCTNAIIKAGATPVLVDPDIRTFNIKANDIEKKITNKTKALLIPHIYGLPCEMDAILELAKKHHLYVIEDAAETQGQTYKDKPCGSFGDVSIFSFYANKHVTTGEGGMLLCDDESLYKKAKSLKDHSFMPGRRFIHDEIGFNYRMTNIQAALGLAQIEQLDDFIKRKREIGNLYINLLNDIQGIELPLRETEYAQNVYWAFTITISDKRFKADELAKKLRDKGIGTRPSFWPLNKQPAYNKHGLFTNNEDFPNSYYLSDYTLYLPCGLGLKNEQIHFICDTLREILKV